jgi:hypothetical protein
MTKLNMTTGLENKTNLFSFCKREVEVFLKQFIFKTYRNFLLLPISIGTLGTSSKGGHCVCFG